MLVVLLAIILAGPVGLMYNLYQPLAAVKSDADQKVCCVEDEGKYALSQDGRWLAMVKPTPERYFGLGDKIARAPYVAALVDKGRDARIGRAGDAAPRRRQTKAMISATALAGLVTPPP